jgi:general secretion pathway protein D
LASRNALGGTYRYFWDALAGPFPVTIWGMRWSWSIVTVTVLATAGFCADQQSAHDIPLLPCGEGAPAAASCAPSKQELKDAKAAFGRALKLQNSKRMDEAFGLFETAARLVPRNVEYVTAREIARQKLVFDDLQRGNAALLSDRQVEALADFRSALELDPHNDFAQQRLRDALGEWLPKTAATPTVVEDSGVLRVAPSEVRADFHYRGDSRALLTQIARVFGIEATFDESVAQRSVSFDIGDVDFYTAMRTACDVTHTFWTPLHEKQILIAAESAENHRTFDHLALRTFHIPGLTGPTDLTNMVSLLRNVFEIKFITPQPQSGTISVRAPVGILDAATEFLESLDSARPEIMLQVKVYEINHSLMRNLGLQIPNQFNLFNIPVAALLALGGQNIQDLVNQLISSGGINQANSTAISALLAQLQGQGQQNSIFSQPLATFGNGLTLMGLSLGTAGAQFGLNQSAVKHVQDVTLRVSQGNDATFRVGSRYPILNASFAPIFNSSAISQVLQNNSFQAPFPSFSYEDLGLNIKARPTLSGDAISLHLEMQVRTLAGQSVNGVPVISNKEFQGNLTLMEGQPAVVAGAITRSETRTLTGLPGLGAVPGLNQVMTSNSKQEEDDELLIVITPRVVARSARDQAAEVWLAR